MGLRNPNRPFDLFYFGPSGVGKTELSRALADAVYGERAFTRIDMSEFAEAHAVQRLTGAPPGYVGYEAGGQLTNAVRQQPYSLILLDELEKAHPRAADIFLQILDDGRLTDGQGRTVNFTNATVIATSNAKDLHATFRAEFLNRFDAIVEFRPLDDGALLEIARAEIRKVETRTARHGVRFSIDVGLLRAKISELRDDRMGARPIKRFIEQTCESLIEIKIGQATPQEARPW